MIKILSDSSRLGTQSKNERTNAMGYLECLYDGTDLKHWPDFAANEALIDLSSIFKMGLTGYSIATLALGGASLTPLLNFPSKLAYTGKTETGLRANISAVSPVPASVALSALGVPVELKSTNSLYLITFTAGSPGRVVFSYY